MILTKRKINIIAVVLPIIVLSLFQIEFEGDFAYLPHIYSPINGIVSILLIISIVQIKKGNKKVHERLIKLCMVLTLIFLGLYTIYHATTEETIFQGGATSKYIYYFILATHILMSVVAIPFVLYSFYYASIKDYINHRRIAKKAFGFWLYVSITGVLVYLMIFPYY